MFCVLVSGDATGQVFGSVRVGHGGNRDWRSSLAAAQEGAKASGARWVRLAHTGCAHHVPGGQIMLRPQTMVPPFMHISAMKACHVSPWANGACGPR
ncbi:hypothetical protein BGC30_12445 [Novacetimonas hansenii]|nr:hypothetical protein BGC30_12445 [Novacetimonas hansenii]